MYLYNCRNYCFFISKICIELDEREYWKLHKNSYPKGFPIPLLVKQILILGFQNGSLLPKTDNEFEGKFDKYSIHTNALKAYHAHLRKYFRISNIPYLFLWSLMAQNSSIISIKWSCSISSQLSLRYRNPWS